MTQPSPVAVISPIDASVAHEYRPLGLDAARATVDRARLAQRVWKARPMADRVELCTKMLEHFAAKANGHATLISKMMGKPLAEAQGEARVMAGRVEALCRLAPEALADEPLPAKEGFHRFIRHEPVGVVLDIAAWNYPLLVPIGAVAGAVLAGDSVLIKHAPQTAACGAMIADAFAEAGALMAAPPPEGLVSDFMVSHETVGTILDERRVDQVAFTGSVRGGHEVFRAAARENFMNVGLELGGKDAALVLPDCDFEFTVANLVEGAFYNAGQSCCAIERIYVHAALYDRFVEAYLAEAKKLKLGNPLAAGTTLGPVVNADAAARVRAQVEAAVAAGATDLLAAHDFAVPDASPCYLAPAMLVDVDHTMAVMREETFGPAIGIMKVASEAEAVALANDSSFGLTASIWSTDDARVEAIAGQLEVGTVFQNRADFLDPELPWVGVKDSGSGVSLSHLGLRALTRPKSFHLRRREPAKADSP
ncbi:aldehyde dehydrogenase family protein [Plesiocystis pacifica]|nr:aldehyde dehydrogenase family protein [Plesiocystis pacifica]